MAAFTMAVHSRASIHLHPIRLFRRGIRSPQSHYVLHLVHRQSLGDRAGCDAHEALVCQACVFDVTWPLHHPMTQAMSPFHFLQCPHYLATQAHSLCRPCVSPFVQAWQIGLPALSAASHCLPPLGNMCQEQQQLDSYARGKDQTHTPPLRAVQRSEERVGPGSVPSASERDTKDNGKCALGCACVRAAEPKAPTLSPPETGLLTHVPVWQPSSGLHLATTKLLPNYPVLLGVSYLDLKYPQVPNPVPARTTGSLQVLREGTSRPTPDWEGVAIAKREPKARHALTGSTSCSNR